MKQLLSFLFCCFFFTATFAQKDDFFVLSPDQVEHSEKITLPFSFITVVDARFDKSNVGCVVKNLSFNGMTKNKLAAIFPDSFQTYLPKLLNKIISLKENTTDTMLVLIKQFRIADHLFNTFDTYHTPETVLTLSASFFKKEHNNLLKIFSLNNSWAEAWKTGNTNELAILRNEAIVSLLSKVFEKRDWMPQKSSFSLADMENGLRKRFQLPVYSDAVLKPGVYKTFEDFKNNSPTVTNVNLGMYNDELVQVLDESNHPVSTKTYWGACDGKYRYVVFRGVLNKLLPIDKSFRFVSYRGEIKYNNNIEKSINPFASHTRVKPEYFYLNMDTGKVYLEELIGTADYEKTVRILNSNLQ